MLEHAIRFIRFVHRGKLLARFTVATPDLGCLVYMTVDVIVYGQSYLTGTNLSSVGESECP